jgi:hypothetical protein
MNIGWITDVNIPVPGEAGGFWFVESAPGCSKIAGPFKLKDDAVSWMFKERCRRKAKKNN